MKLPKEYKTELIVNYENRLFYFKHAKPEQVKSLKEYLRKPDEYKAVYTYRGPLNPLIKDHRLIRRMLTALFRVSSSTSDSKVHVVKLSDRSVKVSSFLYKD